MAFVCMASCCGRMCAIVMWKQESFPLLTTPHTRKFPSTEQRCRATIFPPHSQSINDFGMNIKKEDDISTHSSLCRQPQILHTKYSPQAKSKHIWFISLYRLHVVPEYWMQPYGSKCHASVVYAFHRESLWGWIQSLLFTQAEVISVKTMKIQQN